MDAYYQEKFEAANEYMDFITVQLLRYGISLNQFASRKYQFEVGESASGIEVKYDMRLHETGNLFIESAERKQGGPWTPSGINREDGSRFYLIGDYAKALLMAKHQLRTFVRDKQEIVIARGTSKGYIFPYERLQKSTLCLIEFKFT